MNIDALYALYLQYPSVKTDTRTLQAGDMFFALKGPHYNANAFAAAALTAGASYAVIDEAQYVIDERTILVNDVLTVLQALAKHHRQTFTIPFIAITGSNGKTTSKELIHAVLSQSYKTYTTPGNLNNQIGIPLTLLGIRKDAQVAVIEMGANHLKEIESYCRYALPTHGLITNIGKAHLEGFGGPEGVKKAKGELFDFIRATGGTAFVMWDYDYLREMSTGISQLIRYGTTEGEVTGMMVQSDPYLEVSITSGAAIPGIQTQLVGGYNLPNVLAAVAIGKYFSVEDNLIRAAIERYVPSNSRSQLMEKGSNKIILDAYNANPSSMKLAIENFARLQAGNKVLMLGAMAELGLQSLEEHQSLVQLISQFQWKDVVLVGGDFLNMVHPYVSCISSVEAKAWLQQQRLEDSYILVKGSRSMQMEKILE